MTAQAGDYLAILPQNPMRDVHRVLAHFDLSADAVVSRPFHSTTVIADSNVQIELNTEGHTSLPTGQAIAVSSLLSGYVEISQPATTGDLRVLHELAHDPLVRSALQQLIKSYAENIALKRISVLDLLELHPGISLPFAHFLALLPPMRVRQYSISSSPLWNPEHVTLTVSVLDAPALSGTEEPFLGVASNYLASLRQGDRVHMAVRSSNTAFRLPTNTTTPIVMFCAGSGLAPMRGFIQERAIQKTSGRNIGKMLLFFGCQDPDKDYLYSNTDLKAWVDLGVVDVRPAFSTRPEASEGCRHVQE
jgi:cytochrome P450/NADPH-cytochrome P450 reductase